MQEAPDSTSVARGAIPLENPVSESYSTSEFQPIQVSLIDSENLWAKFSKLGTEMVITKSGRHMFPGVKLLFENLKPYTFYKVYMELAPVDNIRYKYERYNWMPRAPISPIPSSWIEHPQSPAEGFKWMLKPIDFDVKLTNCTERMDQGTVCLRSMFKYMIVIHVEEGSDSNRRNPLLTRTFPLVKTTFIAVTSYQNPQVKDLKTDTNIHAKGVRFRKFKYLQCIYEDTKENVSDMFKKPRLEHKTNNSADQRSESPSSSEPAIVVSSSSPIVHSSWNGMYHRMPEFTHRRDLLLPPVPQYQRIHAPSFNERVPLTTPLTVHCPPSFFHYEPATYYNPYLPLHPQRFPFYHSTPPPSIYPENWENTSSTTFNCQCNRCTENTSSKTFNCQCNSCTMSNLNVCSTCKDGFRECVSCRILENTNAAPTSTDVPPTLPADAAPSSAAEAAPISSTDAEVSSSSFQNSRFSSSPTAPEFTAPTCTTRDSSQPTSEAEDSSENFRAIDEISSSIAEAIRSSGSLLKFDSAFRYA